MRVSLRSSIHEITTFAISRLDCLVVFERTVGWFTQESVALRLMIFIVFLATDIRSFPCDVQALSYR